MVTERPSLATPGLAAVWDRVRDRLERAGVDNRGRMRLPALPADARLALEAVTGRRTTATVDLAALEQGLRSLGLGDDLPAALAALGHPVSDLPGRRRAERTAARQGREAARAEAGTWAEPWASAWIDEVIRAGVLRGCDAAGAVALVRSVRRLIDHLDTEAEPDANGGSAGATGMAGTAVLTDAPRTSDTTHTTDTTRTTDTASATGAARTNRSIGTAGGDDTADATETTGTTRTTGATGATGAAGAANTTRTTGATGTTRATGATGATRTTGATGATGAADTTSTTRSVGAADAIGARGAAMSRVDLAARLFGSAHALDAGTRLEAGATRALAHRLGAGQARDLWERAGAHLDLTSGPVLTWRLPVASTSRLAPLVDQATVLGVPLHLSQFALRTHPVTPAPGADVLVVENPRIVEAAAQADSATAVVAANGNPSGAVRLLLSQLAEAGARLRYHGDFDAAGLAICARMHAVGLVPWRMDADDYLAALDAADSEGVDLPVNDTPAPPTPWHPVLRAVFDRERRIVHEERLLATLIGS